MWQSDLSNLGKNSHKSGSSSLDNPQQAHNDTDTLQRFYILISVPQWPIKFTATLGTCKTLWNRMLRFKGTFMLSIRVANKVGVLY